MEQTHSCEGIINYRQGKTWEHVYSVPAITFTIRSHVVGWLLRVTAGGYTVIISHCAAKTLRWGTLHLQTKGNACVQVSEHIWCVRVSEHTRDTNVHQKAYPDLLVEP